MKGLALRRSCRALFAIAANFVLVAECRPATAVERVRPNILVIVGDDMGYADIGVHGCKDIPTPHIDSLAKNGVRCTSGYVSGPYCSPTRAGLLTGRYQTRFGHEFNPGGGRMAAAEHGLSLKERTLADRLRAAGYRTAMVGKWHLGGDAAHHPMSRGFESYYGFLGGAHPYLPKANGALQGVWRNREEISESEYLTDAFAREALAAVESLKAAPFFLYWTFNAVHTPMEATAKHKSRFPNIKDPRRQTYAGMMAAMDDAIGAMLRKLDEEKLLERTLIFFVSDNGGPPVNASDNGPLNGHKATTWEGGVRVPFLMQWTGTLPAGKVYDKPVIQLDFHATALVAAGLTIDPSWKLDGVDLIPYVTGKDPGAPHDALYWRFGRQMAIRRGDWKLVKANGMPAIKAGDGAVDPDGAELFNLKDDLGERTDVSDKHPEVVKDLANAWTMWNADNVPATWGSQRSQAKRKGL